MLCKNTQSKWEYIIDNIVLAFLIMIWYRNLLFRCFNNLSLRESKFLLWVVVISFITVGIVIRIKKYRNLLSIFVNTLFPFGIYTILIYAPIAEKLITTIMCFVGFFSIVHIVLIWRKKIKNRHKTKHILKRRINRTLTGVQMIASIGMTIIMIALGHNVLFGSTIMQASVEPVISSERNEQTIENNITILLQLQEDTWKTLSIQERLNVLQTVANIEADYLGITNELNVGAANLKENILGQYEDNTHEILISLDSLINDTAEELLDTVCHEAYHSYQYRIVDVYHNVDENTQNLKFFAKARSYSEEFNNYANETDNFNSYYYQECEIDARVYAKSAVCKYYEHISYHLKKIKILSESPKNPKTFR